MRGQAYYNDGESEQGFEVEIPPRKPLTEERFAEICKIIRTAMACGAIIAAIWLAGTPAVVGAGFIGFFWLLVKYIN